MLFVQLREPKLGWPNSSKANKIVHVGVYANACFLIKNFQVGWPKDFLKHG